MPLVMRTPMALEIDRRDLPNRVNDSLYAVAIQFEIEPLTLRQKMMAHV